jgi:hypothetical protein
MDKELFAIAKRQGYLIDGEDLYRLSNNNWELALIRAKELVRDYYYVLESGEDTLIAQLIPTPSLTKAKLKKQGWI